MKKTYCLSYLKNYGNDYVEFLEKNKLYIGLPELLEYTFDVNRNSTMMSLSKTNYGIFIDGMYEPIYKNCDNLHFICEDNTLIDTEGTKKNILEIDKHTLVIAGGRYNNKIGKIYLTNKGFKMNDTHISLDNVYFCEYIDFNYVSRSYDVQFTPLLEHKFFSNYIKSPNLIPVKEIINRHNLKIINLTLLNEMKEKYYDDCEQAFKVNCDTESIYVNKYLKLFFKDLSPIYQKSFKDSEGKHDINTVAFKQIIRWMKKLLLENKFPTEKELVIDNVINVVEWLYICDYFGIIDLLRDFFEDIKLSLENYNDDLD